MASLIVAAVPADETGVASGMNANIRTIGGSIGAAVMAGVVTAHRGPAACPARPATSTASSCSPARWALALAALLPEVRRAAFTHDAPAVPLSPPRGRPRGRRILFVATRRHLAWAVSRT